MHLSVLIAGPGLAPAGSRNRKGSAHRLLGFEDVANYGFEVVFVINHFAITTRRPGLLYAKRFLLNTQPSRAIRFQLIADLH